MTARAACLLVLVALLSGADAAAALPASEPVGGRAAWVPSLYAAYVGVASAVAVFNLIPGLWWRERGRLNHALYFVTLAFAVLSAEGLAGEYLFARVPAAAERLAGIGTVLAFAIGAWGFMLVRHGGRETRLCHLAFAVHYAGLLIDVGRNFNVLAPGLVADNALLVGSALHMLLVSVVLTSRGRDAERAKCDAERQALAAGRDALARQREGIAAVSHEFRTPLAVISAAAQTLAFELPEDVAPDARRRIEKIRRAVGRLTTLIENCLSDERLALGNAPACEDVDLCDLLRTLADEWRASAAVPLRLALPDGCLTAVVACDKALIAIAVSNLLDNAVKHSVAGGEILLRLEHAGDKVLLSVADRGIGIAAEDLGRIFDKFHRTAAAAGTPGVGLGLYLVRQIARRHGGDVAATSSPGQGSVFCMNLPCGRMS